MDEGRYQISSETVFLPVPEGVFLRRNENELLIRGRHAVAFIRLLSEQFASDFDLPNVLRQLPPAKRTVLEQLFSLLIAQNFFEARPGESDRADRDLLVLSDEQIPLPALPIPVYTWSDGEQWLTSGSTGEGTGRQTHLVLVAMSRATHDLTVLRRLSRQSGVSWQILSVPDDRAWVSCSFEGPEVAEPFIEALDDALARHIGPTDESMELCSLWLRAALDRVLDGDRGSPRIVRIFDPMRCDTSDFEIARPIAFSAALVLDRIKQRQPVMQAADALSAVSRMQSAEADPPELQGVPGTTESLSSVAYIGEANFKQIPLCRSEVRLESDEFIAAAVGSGMTYMHSRWSAMQAAAETHFASLVLDADDASADADLAGTSAESTHTVWALTLPSLRFHPLRVVQATSGLLLGPSGVYATAAATSYAGLLERALTRLALPTNPAAVDTLRFAGFDARDMADSRIDYLTDVLCALDVSPRLVIAESRTGLPVACARFTENRVAFGAALDPGIAVRRALLAALQNVQANRHDEPTDSRLCVLRVSETQLQINAVEPPRGKSLYEALSRSNDVLGPLMLVPTPAWTHGDVTMRGAWLSRA